MHLFGTSWMLAMAFSATVPQKIEEYLHGNLIWSIPVTETCLELIKLIWNALDHISVIEIRARNSDADQCVQECTFLLISRGGNHDVRILDIQKFCISSINVSV